MASLITFPQLKPMAGVTATTHKVLQVGVMTTTVATEKHGVVMHKTIRSRTVHLADLRGMALKQVVQVAAKPGEVLKVQVRHGVRHRMLGPRRKSRTSSPNPRGTRQPRSQRGQLLSVRAHKRRENLQMLLGRKKIHTVTGTLKPLGDCLGHSLMTR